MRSPWALIASTLVIAGIGCSDSPAAITPRTVSPRLVIVSGDAQTAEVGTIVAQPLTVKLLGTTDAPVPGHFVVFRGGSRVDSVLTNAIGVASMMWTLPENIGDYQVDASAVLDGKPVAGVTWRVTAVAGVARSVALIGPDSAVVAPGTELDTLRVRVTDRYGNPIGDLSVGWSVISGGGSMSVLDAKTTANGQATALWTVGADLGQNLVAVSAGDAAVRLTATSSPSFSAASVTAGDDHSCALDTAGAAACWGANGVGQLGIGSAGPARRNPVKVAGGLRFVSLALGHAYTCGLTAAGDALCWGANDVAQLGSGVAGVASPLPVRVAGAHAFTALAAGRRHACGLTTRGEVYCWGESTFGQTGDGALGVHYLPAIVTTTERFTALSAGNDFTCALSVQIYCWGNDERRQLGADGLTCVIGTVFDEYEGVETNLLGSCSTIPVRVTTSSAVVSLVSGATGSCGVTADTRLVCWGDGLRQPTLVGGIPLAGSVAIGNGVVCGLDTDGGLGCSGIAGNAAAFGAAENVSFASLTGSASNLCGVSRAMPAIVYCWGSNDAGQLGDGTWRRREAPVPVVSTQDR